MNPSSAAQFTPPMCPFNNCPSSLRWWIWSARRPPPPTAVYKTGFLINVASWESNCHLPLMKINVARCFEERQVFLNHLCTLETATVKSNVTCNFFFFQRYLHSLCRFRYNSNKLNLLKILTWRPSLTWNDFWRDIFYKSITAKMSAEA